MTDLEIKQALFNIEKLAAEREKLTRDWRYSPWFLFFAGMATATAFIAAVSAVLIRYHGAY